MSTIRIEDPEFKILRKTRLQLMLDDEITVAYHQIIKVVFQNIDWDDIKTQIRQKTQETRD